jgi:hypothetical protein
MLTIHIAVKLQVFVVVLGNVNIVIRSLLVVLAQDLTVGSFKRLEVFSDGLEVVDGKLRNFAVFFILFEKWLEGVVAEKGDLHQVFETLHGHINDNYIINL